MTHQGPQEADQMRQRFARLMNNEEGAWVRPSAPEPDLSQPMPVRTAPTTSQHPTEEDEYDSDDPEQVCNARFAPPPPKTTGRNARIRGRGKQSAKQPAAPTSSANPVLLKQLEKKVFPSLGLSIGERSKYALAFVPWKLVVEYPQHFVGKTNFNKSYPFFDPHELFKAISWDFFYLHHPTSSQKSPYVFVPTTQFEHLLEVINCALSIQLRIPNGLNEEKFRMTWGNFGTPQPKYLGRASSVKDLQDLLAREPDICPDEKLDGVSPQAAQDFLERLRTLFSVGNGKKKTDPAEALAKRIAQRRGWGRTIKRVQRYLGLRDRGPKGQQSLHKADWSSTGCAPYDFDRNVVFVAIDIEAYEHNNNLITEVGFAVLDTKWIQNVPAGDGGRAWFSKIQASHFLVKENTWAVNKDYVAGCPLDFRFGVSRKVAEKELLGIIQSIAEQTGGGNLTVQDQANKDEGKRNVILVFHDPLADIAYLDQLGYDVHDAANVLEVVDTRTMHQHFRRRPNPTKLQNVLSDLGVQCFALHNAGNDAVYTLQAMLGIAIQRRIAGHNDLKTARPSQESTSQDPRPNYYLGTETDGWLTGGEASDGGPPVLDIPQQKPKKRARK